MLDLLPHCLDTDGMSETLFKRLALPDIGPVVELFQHSFTPSMELLVEQIISSLLLLKCVLLKCA